MDSGHEERELTSGFSIPVSRLALGAAALVVVGVAFYGGVAFEKQRSDAELATVSELRDALGEKDSPDAERAKVAEPLELQVDESVEVEGPDGNVMLTLDSVQLIEEYPGDRRQRYIELAVTIRNLTGRPTVVASLNRYFEDNLGTKHEPVLTTCTEGRQLPADPVPAGRFVQGCESMSIPDDAGRVVLDGFTPELYVEVPAA
ncbi:hypothetical protein [Aeromicrobium sp.]|uniref:hypothetical protein n=1 Tax=Aeromicrobium sp. TaxID=1871063 RepID=UPI0028AD3947|nr:hypothetical protein [Aeromicrobium sp.]